MTLGLKYISIQHNNQVIFGECLPSLFSAFSSMEMDIKNLYFLGCYEN